MTDSGAPGGARTPRVSVVLICFDDADRLPHAIASAREQTLADIEIIVVDHGSTDGSVSVAEAAAAADPRIRVIALGDNEGKPGRPINAGIRAATAPWVTVFASDDVLRPRACEVMLGAAERYGADIVVGSLQRVNMETGEATRWMPSVTLRSRVVADIDQLPDLIRDTTGGGKLYSTDFIRRHDLSFPEDIYYQDQVFTLEYYASARTVAVVSTFVLEWRHWPSGRQSVTQRRSSVENLWDRFTANGRIDEYLRRTGRTDLLVRKQRKFLQHDLSIHVKDLSEASDDYRTALVAATRDYTASFPPESFTGLPLNKHLMLNCIRAGRLDDAERVATVPFNRITTQWRRVTAEGRVYVLPPWLPTRPDEQFDVTDYRLPDVPQRFRSARAEVALSAAGDHLEMALTVARQDKPLPDGAGLTLVLQDAARGTSRHLPLRGSAGDYRGRVSAAELDESFGGEPGPVTMVVLAHEGTVDRWSAQVHVGDDQPPVAVAQWRATAADDAVVLTRTPGPAAPPRRLLRRARPVPPPAAAELLSLAEAREYLAESPIEPQDDHAFFESFAGRRIGGGPLVLSHRLHERRRKVRQTWSCTAWSLLDVPGHAVATQRYSRAALDALAGAGVWVDNGWLPFRPGENRRLVQLWHGVPLVRLPEQPRRPRWFLVPSSGPAFERWLDAPYPRPYSHYRPVGAPHTDPLLGAAARRRRDELRAAWGLTERTVVLFAPALRPGDVSPAYRQPDLHAMAAALGDSWFWLHREHDDEVEARRVATIPDDLRWFAATTSARVELTDYLLMADVLVSDYASLISDAGVAGRPVVHYAPDRQFVEDVSPGTNISLKELAAGPVVADDGELVAALQSVSATRTAAESAAFTAEVAPHDRRESADAVLDTLGW